MAEEFETIEIEYSEDDVLYYLFDEDDNEIGIVIEEDGKEVEYYYEWVNREDYENLEAVADDSAVPTAASSAEPASGGAAASGANNAEPDDGKTLEPSDLQALDGEVVEMEIDEDAIDHYLFDTEGNEIGFVIVEDGVEIECYYQEDDEDDAPEAVGANGSGAPAKAGEQPAAAAEPKAPEEPEDHGYLYKLAQIAGHEGNKARKKAGAQIDRARDKAKPVVDQARTKAEAGIDKATEAVESGGERLKKKSDDYDLGITREGVKEATADLNAIAKEGAETAKELKEAYDDIMDSFGFLMPKGIRRKLP